MDRKVKFVQYGCGKMSVYLMRYAIEHGAEPVGAFDVNPGVIGKDISDITGMKEKTGITISDAKELDSVLKKEQPDVCIVATRSTMEEIYEPYSICAQNGINAISTCEESLYPWNSAPKITKELDEMAKKSGATLSGAGYPDMYWGVLIDTLAGSMHNITKIKGSSSYNVEDYGIALAEGHGAGLSMKDFDKEIGGYNSYSHEQIQELVDKGEWIPSYMWTQNGWLAAKMGLTVVSQTQKNIPMTHTEDLHSETLGMTIKAGQPTGMASVVTTTTKEGIILETESIGKVYAPDEFDKNDWTLYGEPETTINVNRPATVELTCSELVGRIPALIDSEPGYVTTNNFPNNVYLIEDLHKYVKTK